MLGTFCLFEWIIQDPEDKPDTYHGYRHHF
jgi:hypothetical protein